MSNSTNNILPLKLHEFVQEDKKTILDQLPVLNNNKKIKLRARHVPTKSSRNKHSLFLDISKDGKRERRYLKLYVDLKRNTHRNDKEIFKLAIEIRDNLELELFQNEQDFEMNNYKLKANFVPYFKNIVDKKAKSLKPYKNTYNYLDRFTGGSINFKSVDELFCRKFKEYLLANVSQNTAHTYLARLKVVLNNAIEDKIIKYNPARLIQIKKQDVKREFLTEKEIKILINTTCPNEQTKRAFLFTCFTGLRYSDVAKLTFDEIQEEYIVFRQKKTEEHERIKLSENALEIINQQKPAHPIEGKIFDLQFHNSTILHMKKWVKKAGINKNITWHVGRHTFATLALTYDIDIYTVSKLLGHKEVKTTQIYARLIDKKKDEAIDKLPKI